MLLFENDELKRNSAENSDASLHFVDISETDVSKRVVPHYLVYRLLANSLD